MVNFWAEKAGCNQPSFFMSYGNFANQENCTHLQHDTAHLLHQAVQNQREALL